MDVLVDRRLPAHPSSVSYARTLARAALDGRCGEEAAAQAQLIVSELVTNCIVHARSDCSLRLEMDGTTSTIRVAVGDRSTTYPRPRRVDPTVPGGRGLQIVERLATRWGVEPEPVGKRVFADLRC